MVEKRRLFVERPVHYGYGRSYGNWTTALADDFERHGTEVIERVRIEKPDGYLKVIALGGS